MNRKTQIARGTGLAPVTVESSKFLHKGTDELFRRFINDLNAIQACLGRISAKFHLVIGLSASQHHILRVIAELGTEPTCNVNKVAELLHMNPTQVTRELKTLVRLKLVKKASSARDRREVLLSVTDDGMSLLKDIAPILREINETLFGAFSKEDFNRLCGLIHALTGQIDRTLLITDLLMSGGLKEGGSGQPIRPRR